MAAPEQKPRILYGIGYCRVSGDEQEEGTSLEDQEKEIRAYAAANGIILVDIVKETYTGTVYRERKVLSQIRERYRAGEINCVIVRTFDRLARNEMHFAVLLDEMEHHKVELHCVKEKLDDSIMGRLARNIIASFAEFEHQKIIERTLTGKRNLVLLKKQIIPGPKPLYGYDWKTRIREKKTKHASEEEKIALVVKQEEALTVLRIHTLYDEGISIRKIIRVLVNEGVPPPAKCWNYKTILRILKEERYIGHGMAFTTHGHNARYPLEPTPLPENSVPAIVPVDLFERNQHRLGINRQEASRHHGGNPKEFLLRTSFLRCGECGYMMRARRKVQGSRNPVRSHMYMCLSRYNIPPSNCPGQIVNSKRLDELVWNAVEQLADDTAVLEEAIRIAMQDTNFDADVKALSQSIANGQEQVRQYQEDLKDPNLRGGARSLVIADLSHVQEMVERLEYEKAMLQTGQIDMQQVTTQLQKILDWCQTVREKRGDLSYEGKRMFMHMLGIEVYLYKTDKRKEDIDFEINFKVPEIARLVAPYRGQESEGNNLFARHTGRCIATGRSIV